jgi:outer membrane receptor for ferrienterochelin and colicin
LCLSSTAALAQEAPPVVANLSLDELNNLRVNIASVTSRPVREQPGLVTVISEQDIAASGATDLMDILSLVPGFAFATDVGKIAGTGFRGLWGYEGKILLLLDGISVNDGLYGNILARDHYAADQIKQIEIIRGPGSAVYGGSAELAVISITTKGAEQNGGFVSVRPEFDAGFAGTAVSGHAGYQLEHQWRISFGASYRSVVDFDRSWQASNGTVLSLTGAPNATPSMVNAAVGWRALDVRVIYDGDEFRNPTGVEVPGLQSPWTFSWPSFMTRARYEWKPSNRLTLTPQVTFDTGRPWRAAIDDGPTELEIAHRKVNVDIPVVVTFDTSNRLRAGITAFREQATALQLDPRLGYPAPGQYFNGSNQVHYHDVAGYAQYELDAKWASITIGGRYEDHEATGGAFVPRVAFTRTWDAFHVKLLYDRAFRTPNIGDLQQTLQDLPITNERTEAYQVEAGYRLGSRLSVVGSGYYVTIEKPIAFAYQSATSHGYVNGSAIGSRGTEFELRYADDTLTAATSYSYYDATSQLSGALGLYGSSIAGVNLGLPSHKASFSGTYHVRRQIDWNTSGTWLSARQAYGLFGAEQQLPGELNVNTRVEYRLRSTAIAFAVRNLFGGAHVLGQAYNGGTSPVSLPGRNYSVAVTYRFK